MENKTPVASDAGTYKGVEQFAVGDLVYVADDASLSSFSQKQVRFSSGTGPGGHNVMVKVSYGAPGAEDSLVVTRNQVFLLADKTLKQAVALVPGIDRLLRHDGTTVTAVPIHSLQVVVSTLGVHHIATSQAPAQDPAGHLILAKGIVCGDYSLQVGFAAGNRAANIEAPPEFGTKEYFEKYTHLHHSGFHASTVAPNAVAVAPTGPAAISDHRPLGLRPAKIPDHAHYFVSEAQALDLFKYAPSAPASSGVGIALTNYLFTLY